MVEHDQDDDKVVQVAAIPFCRREDGIFVCLIRTRHSRSWGIPKGFIDPGDTREETALNEAWEEVGLRGRLVGRPLGTYQYRKWRAHLTVIVYLMEVQQEEPTWQEGFRRERCWHRLEDALALLSRHPVRHLLPRANALLTGATSD